MDDDRELVIECSMRDSADWLCHVSVTDAGQERGYDVTVTRAELGRFAPGHYDPTMLVAQSFRFLLDREGPDSILSTFAISDIERYFPEFSIEIPRLMSR
jgi:hypothetical protein